MQDGGLEIAGSAKIKIAARTKAQRGWSTTRTLLKWGGGTLEVAVSAKITTEAEKSLSMGWGHWKLQGVQRP